jgi:translation elongation factor EF-Tu-like GTPase
MKNFKFKCSNVFGIVGRGIVFCGYTEYGEISKNDKVRFSTEDGYLSARVDLIELNREIVDRTEDGQEHGIILCDFSDKMINEYVKNANDESKVPPKELLNIGYPVYLEPL